MQRALNFEDAHEDSMQQRDYSGTTRKTRISFEMDALSLMLELMEEEGGDDDMEDARGRSRISLESDARLAQILDLLEEEEEQEQEEEEEENEMKDVSEPSTF